MSVPFISSRAELCEKADDRLPEFQRRSIHLDAEEGQQARANGVLSGDDRF